MIRARFGLDHETLLGDNPGLVYCSVEGFGDTGTAAELPGYDLLAQAASGLMSVTGEVGARPLKVGAALVDVVCALHAAVGVLAAVHDRQRTGTGRRVQVSLFDAALSSLINQSSAVVAGGTIPASGGNDHPSIAPYSTFRASDRDLVIAVGNDRQFDSLCHVLGEADATADARFTTNSDRVEHRRELRDVIEAALAARTAAEWIELLTAANVPAGPINDIGEAIEFATQLGLDPIALTTRDDGTTVPTIRSPIRIDGDRLPRPDTVGDAAPHRAPPLLGAHDAELRAWLTTS